MFYNKIPKIIESNKIRLSKFIVKCKAMKEILVELYERVIFNKVKILLEKEFAMNESQIISYLSVPRIGKTKINFNSSQFEQEKRLPKKKEARLPRVAQKSNRLIT